MRLSSDLTFSRGVHSRPEGANMTRRMDCAFLTAALMFFALACKSQLQSLKEAPKCQALMEALQQDYATYNGKLAAAKTNAEKQKVREGLGPDPFRRYIPKFEA